MSAQFIEGHVVAIFRTDTGNLIATAKVDRVTSLEIRTETPYEQRHGEHELSRRHWRAAAPFSERRVPRAEKSTCAPCAIRHATSEDIALANRLAEARRAKERMPRNQREKAEYERRIALAEAALLREREPYERLLAQMDQDARLLADISA